VRQVLFFEQSTTIREYQDKFPLYAAKVPTWAVQSSGMSQFAVWTALQQEGFGANLQHYNPLIDTRVAAEWDIPNDWELSAQLVFGSRLAEPNQKTFQNVEDRLKIYGADVLN
jgi:predicted oxidoreductase (fatty acid repression mutant protein)